MKAADFFQTWVSNYHEDRSTFQKTVHLIISSLYFIKYIHSPTCDHPTYEDPELQPKFPCENFASIYYEVSLSLYYFTLHLELYAQRVDYQNVRYWDNERLYFASHSTSWWVYIPPHFLFSSYDQVFRTHAVRKSRSARVQDALMKVLPSSLKDVVRSISPWHVLLRCLQDEVLLRNLNLISEIHFKQALYLEDRCGPAEDETCKNMDMTSMEPVH